MSWKWWIWTSQKLLQQFALIYCFSSDSKYFKMNAYWSFMGCKIIMTLFKPRKKHQETLITRSILNQSTFHSSFVIEKHIKRDPIGFSTISRDALKSDEEQKTHSYDLSRRQQSYIMKELVQKNEEWDGIIAAPFFIEICFLYISM